MKNNIVLTIIRQIFALLTLLVEMLTICFIAFENDVALPVFNFHEYRQRPFLSIQLVSKQRPRSSMVVNITVRKLI